MIFLCTKFVHCCSKTEEGRENMNIKKMQGTPTLTGGSRHEHKLLQKVAARNNIMHVHALESSVAGGKKLRCVQIVGREVTYTTRRKRRPASNNNVRLNPKLSSLFFFLLKFYKLILIQILVRYLVIDL